MDREAILFDVADNVATITLNRPDQLNSFNDAMADDMTWAWETVRDTDDIYCVVLQANGERAFCTGLDMKAAGDPWFVKDNTWNSYDPGLTLAPKTHHRVWKPVVAAVHGMCAGGAEYFLNESDIIICSDDAVFFDPHANVGIVSSLEPMGMLQRGVPLGDVLRWALMGNEERITAETALRLGLVTEVAPRAVLRERARGSPCRSHSGTPRRFRGRCAPSGNQWRCPARPLSTTACPTRRSATSRPPRRAVGQEGDSVPLARSGSDPLDDHCGGHATAGAHRDQGDLIVPPLELVERSAHQERAGGPDGVAQGDGAAVHVDLLTVEVEVADELLGHDGEGLVDLE